MSHTPASNLSPVQGKVAELLAAGIPLSQAAAEVGVSRQTIYNWQNTLPDFAQSLDQAKADYTESLKDQLQYLSALALKALQQILEDPKAPAGVKLRAALAILKRPTSALKPGWNLPVVLNPEAQAIQDEIAFSQAEQKLDNLTKLDTNSSPVSKPATPPQPAARIPRGALCPCKSGEKYKRCCGRNAPPVLHKAA